MNEFLLHAFLKINPLTPEMTHICTPLMSTVFYSYMLYQCLCNMIILYLQIINLYLHFSRVYSWVAWNPTHLATIEALHLPMRRSPRTLRRYPRRRGEEMSPSFFRIDDHIPFEQAILGRRIQHFHAFSHTAISWILLIYNWYNIYTYPHIHTYIFGCWEGAVRSYGYSYSLSNGEQRNRNEFPNYMIAYIYNHIILNKKGWLTQQSITGI